jgi:heme-degrading monooxygenase HmoA
MIARIWSARANDDNLQNYIDHFREQVLPELQKHQGYVASTVCTRFRNGESEIIVTTFWESMEAIDGFAGVEREKAVVAGEAAALLTTYDKRVMHYTVDVADKCASILSVSDQEPENVSEDGQALH